MDINRINGVKAGDLADPKTPEALRAREAADRMVERAMRDPNVNQVIGPNGGWNRTDNGWEPIKDPTLLNGHKDHYHINVRRR